MKKNLAYFMGISPNLAFAAGNVAIAINKYHTSGDYDIVIYYSDLKKQDKEALEKIPHCVLEKFVLETKFIDFMMRELPEQCRFKTYDRLMCFSHYETFLLLKKYKYVVWLDADVLIQDDISRITEWGPIGFSADGKRKVGDQFVCRPECKYDLEIPAVQIGLMILEDSIPYEKIYQYCYEKSWEYAKYSLNPEQAVINLMLQEFQLSPVIIPEQIHCDCKNSVAFVASIVHFGTEKKVWNDYIRYDAFPEWYRNHRKWMKLGGSESKEYRVTLRSPENMMEYVRLRKENPFFYDKIPYGSKIIIYGGGAIGHIYIEQMKLTGYCSIVAILDQKANKITDLGKNVSYPEEIRQIKEFDYVVIALEEKERIEEIRRNLKMLRVPMNKIVSRYY